MNSLEVIGVWQRGVLNSSFCVTMNLILLTIQALTYHPPYISFHTRLKIASRYELDTGFYTRVRRCLKIESLLATGK